MGKAVEFLRQVDLPQLLDEQRLAQTIDQVKAMDLQILQGPIEFARWIRICQQHHVKKYLKIGVLNGGSLICVSEILKRTSDLEEIVGIDIRVRSGVATYAKNTPWVKLVQLDTLSQAFESLMSGSRFDAAMVDGSHSTSGCISDTTRCMGISPLVAIHDIRLIAGVAKAYHAICHDAMFSKTIQTVDISKDGPGIGIIAKNDMEIRF